MVGATDWCTHPPDLKVTRVRGTKNPDLGKIVALEPDLVVANEEENRRPDLDALREAGLNVWVTRVRTVPEAFSSLRRLITVACGAAEPEWLGEAEKAWSETRNEHRREAFVAIWRRPWMVVGRDTFAGDVLSRLGVDNVFADHPERYPKISLDELRSTRVDLAVLPDEPYRFTRDDGPEAFSPLPSALVSGRHLTWYGPSLLEAPDRLRRQLDEPFRPSPP
ncbi:ABC-type Fe3+-hydroxamate transport system substrate-binding protein [Kineosporia succinea]|uniref:ABC-type Fe3+-hydroxamate transport system substrate-binding protein n=2 Tax=Kineosporia succinea TaxID=84632 RepID=A0ABT9P2I9_9ACTN|nr:ABC-type Fe3+-hydroxamate transport system substrate-binding protein [Kineosporia succinea]